MRKLLRAAFFALYGINCRFLRFFVALYACAPFT